jgi:hypothetical protein
MNEPYAEIFGFKPGDTKSKIYILPIIYNSIDGAYKIEGAERIKPITIKIHWANQEKDLLEAKRALLEQQKEKCKKWTARYANSRLVHKGRALYDFSLVPLE